MNVDTFIQLVIGGVSLGAIYVLLATGVVVIYRATGVVNFAQGDMATAAAFVALWGLQHLTLGLAGGYVVAILGMGVVGVVLFRLVYVPLRSRAVVAVSIGTLGVALALRGLLLVLFGPIPAGLPSPVGIGVLHLGEVVIPKHQLLVVIVTIVLLAFQAGIFYRTYTGQALRAIAEDQEMAKLLGLRVDRLLTMAFAYGAALAGVAGVLLAPLLSVSLDLGWSVAFYSFIAAIVGGLGSLSGAVFGGILIGLAQELGDFYVSSQFGTTIVFGVMLFALVVRPNGLFNIATAQRL